MVPLKLHIKNFLSYSASQTIDFTPYNLIYLSGKNGHGKSALLDALTWVLWGQARKIGGIAKADEGLMHLGQTVMMVTLDFACDAQRYRVKREYSTVGQKSQALLEFGVFEADHITIRPLTDKTIRATQARIEEVLGLDYDSFINSAFLKQGQSNEFSKKTPKERKEILASILGLERFEALRKKALDKVKAALQRKEQCLLTLERLNKELAYLPTTQEALKEIETKLTALFNQEATITAELHTLAQRLHTLMLRKQEGEKIDFQRCHFEKTKAEQLLMLENSVQQWRSYARTQRLSQNYGQLELERAALQKELHHLQEQTSKRIALKEQYLALKEQLRSSLQQLQDSYKKAHDDLLLSQQSLELSLKSLLQKENEYLQKKASNGQELSALIATLQGLSQHAHKPFTEELDQLEQKLSRSTAYYHTFMAKAQALTAHLSALAHKTKLIEGAEEAVCPLCDQRAQKDALSLKFEQQKTILEHQLRRLTACCKELKKSITEKTTEAQTIKRLIAQQLADRAKSTELEKQQQLLCAEQERLVLDEQLLKKTKAALLLEKEECTQKIILLKQTFLQEQEGSPYKDFQQHLRELEKTAATLIINPTKEKEITERMALLTTLLEQRAAVLQEQAKQEERKRFIQRTVRATLELKQQICSLEKTLKELSCNREEERSLKEAEAQKRQCLEACALQKEQLIHQKGALEARLTHVLECGEVYKQEEQKKVQEEAQAEEYTAIAHALSKDGIQALLIENTLPEIEHEANSLLGRLTDNQAHIFIESVRDLKSGKSKETLDINISDTTGVRPYELFSGGEAFRIDFALRIALSKMLTRRAGSSLQTLIIDEGFGSQDDDGLRNIMAALHTIAEDFSKIIIVSHLPSMKDEFPVHFAVTKTGEGSIVQVIQHC